MLYFADTANLNELKELTDIFPLSGITTNPSIIKKAGIKFSKTLPDLLRLAGKGMLHVQLISDTASDMIDEALKYRSLLKRNNNLYVKIPVTKEGIKAIRLLKELDFGITATAIFTHQQAMLAARAGADFVAPYVNRLERFNGKGIQLIADLAKSINDFGLETKILAASFGTVEQVQEVCLAGAHAVTLNYQLFQELIYHPLTDKAVKQFDIDSQSVYDIPFDKKSLETIEW